MSISLIRMFYCLTRSLNSSGDKWAWQHGRDKNHGFSPLQGKHRNNRPRTVAADAGNSAIEPKQDTGSAADQGAARQSKGHVLTGPGALQETKEPIVAKQDRQAQCYSFAAWTLSFSKVTGRCWQQSALG